MKIRPVGAQFFVWTDGEREMAKVFEIFANTPNNHYSELSIIP